MRFVQFRQSDDGKETIRVGVQKEKNGNVVVVDLSPALPDCHHLVHALAKLGSQRVIDAAKASLENENLERTHFELLAPITSPDKVACVGLNYRDHCEEQGKPIPSEPLIFSKFPSSIIGPNHGIPYPDLTAELDWEVELAVVIGKKGKNIQAALAEEYIFGFTVANDITARDWQMTKNGGQWLLGKTMDGFCPLGPCIVTPDEIPDLNKLAISCRVNGQLKQNSTTSQLVHGVYDCIAWISKFCTLLPGDIILTGTPPGVGAFAKPPHFLKVGDVVECEIENIGVIRNPVI